jgi:hypothetical protein
MVPTVRATDLGAQGHAKDHQGRDQRHRKLGAQRAPRAALANRRRSWFEVAAALAAAAAHRDQRSLLVADSPALAAARPSWWRLCRALHSHAPIAAVMPARTASRFVASAAAAAIAASPRGVRGLLRARPALVVGQ